MQRIANEMALPETTFVFPPEAPETDARVRIFTPSRKLPMAGSPTIGTVFALAGARRLRTGVDKTVLGLGIGPTTVGLEWVQNSLRFAWMTQPIPTFGPIVTDSVAVAAAIGMQPSDLAGGNLPVQVASSKQPIWLCKVMSYHIQPIAKKLGIAKRISWRTFRRTYSSILQDNGEDVKVVQELLRHASTRVTLDVYAQGADTEQTCSATQSGGHDSGRIGSVYRECTAGNWGNRVSCHLGPAARETT